MAGAEAPGHASGPQLGTFSYFKFNPAVHTREKPYEILVNLPPRPLGQPPIKRHNQEFEDHDVPVEDVRGREADFSLNQHGFCWRKWELPSSWRGLNAEDIQSLSEDEIQKEYVADAERFLKHELERQEGVEVDEVKVFDYRLRQYVDPLVFKSRTVDLDNGRDPLLPVSHPHIDQSPDGATQRARANMGDRADELLQRRFRIVNIWRPLKTARNWPLAICDAKSIHQNDLVAHDLVRRRYVGESYFAKFNPNHRWFYLSNQGTDEVTMLKIYDSDPLATARYALHSSFDVGLEDKSRESFEIRALVFDKSTE